MSFDFTNPGYYFWFLPCAAVLSLWIFNKRIQTQLGILLLMSYLFFYLASGWHLVLLLISTIVDWTAGNKIFNSHDQSSRKRWLTISLTVNLCLLGTFKYLDFLIRSLGWWSLKFGSVPMEEIGLVLPVGISFYTFQTMSYTIDIYRRKEEPADSMVSFACYAAFFPQLVAGPIVRYPHFREQINKPLVFTWPRFKLALTLILFGLVKKLVFADNFAVQVNHIFSNGESLDNSILIYWATLLFGLQIYCDFSAYTDIALGSAHLFGIQLPENFRSPYRSRNPREFWRRWHISLSTWLRDYLYIPLGGNRHGIRRMYAALMATMILGGLWHGASWNFVVWGFAHGIILVAHRLISSSSINQSMASKFELAHASLSWIVTQWLVFMTWLIFRVEDTTMMLRSLQSYLLLDSSLGVQDALDAMPDRATFVACLLLVFLPLHAFSSSIDGSAKYHIANLHPTKWGVIIGVWIAAIFLLRPAEVVQFIYFRF